MKRAWNIGGMRITEQNKAVRENPAPLLLRSPHIPHRLTWDQTRTSAVTAQRLTARDMMQTQLTE